jgi:hypothetical protein
MPSHMKVHEGNILTGTQTQSLRMWSPLDGVLSALAVGHLLYRFVPRPVLLGQS